MSLEVQVTKYFLMEILLWPKVIMAFPAVQDCKAFFFPVSVHVFLRNHHESKDLTSLVWVELF